MKDEHKLAELLMQLFGMLTLVRKKLVMREHELDIGKLEQLAKDAVDGFGALWLLERKKYTELENLLKEQDIEQMPEPVRAYAKRVARQHQDAIDAQKLQAKLDREERDRQVAEAQRTIERLTAGNRGL